MARRDEMKPVDTRRLALSWAALVWERLWPALWPAVGVAGLFVGLALLDVFPALPGWFHLLLLIVFVAGFGLAVWREFRGFSLPGRQAALRRLERVNNLQHRPLQSLQDALAGSGGRTDPAVAAIWRRHQERMRRLAVRLRVGTPSPRLMERDRFALRFALVLLLVVGVGMAGNDAGYRLERAAVPQLTLFAPAEPPVMDAWITPPDYTGEPPVFLSRSESVGEEGFVRVPAGSVFVAQVTGGDEAPQLAVGEEERPFETSGPEGGQSYEVQSTLTSTAEVAVRQGEDTLGSWPVDIVPDEPPSIAYRRPPSQTRYSVLRVDYATADDHGVAGAKMVLRRTEDGTASGKTLGEPLEFDIPLAGNQPRKASGTSYQDLTPHPWAGLPVVMTLTAVDGIGQEGRSPAIVTVLPERIFHHPVARQIVSERKQLILDPAANADRVMTRLRALAWQPQLYDHDKVVFLALGTAVNRLAAALTSQQAESLDPATVGVVQELLWDTALRIEDGRLSLAASSLREAEDALREALEGDASDEEIDRLLDELEAAMAEYLSALARMQGEAQEMLPQDQRARIMDQTDLRQMLDQLREMMKSGSRDAARQLLSQLRNMMENLRVQQFAQSNPQARQAMDMLKDLQGLINQQQKLMDQTFRESQQGRPPQGSGQRQSQQFPGRPQPFGQMPDQRFPGDVPGQYDPNNPGNPSQQMTQGAATQEELRQRLGELMMQMGEMSGDIPRPFGRAEGSMRDATGALRQGQPGDAVGAQTKALEELQRGAREATEQLARQLGQEGAGEMEAESDDMDGGRRDPLGRSTKDGSQGMNTSDVNIPDASQLRESRQIRDELRRRAGDRSRPQIEREYIDRLLRRF